MRAWKANILQQEQGSKNMVARREFNRLLGGQKEEADFMQRFNNPNGIQTACFGPCAWAYLHFTSFNYNPKTIEPAAYERLLRAIQETLPCSACRKNFQSNYDVAVQVVQSRDGISNIFKNRYTYAKFIWEFHNQVNAALKKGPGPSFMEVADTYENCRARCVSSSNNSESGCTEPEYKKPVKCVLSFVPRTSADDTMCAPLAMKNNCRRNLP